MKIGLPLRRESGVLAIANNDSAFVTTYFSMTEFRIIYGTYALYTDMLGLCRLEVRYDFCPTRT